MRGGSPGGRPVPFAVPEHLEVVDSTNRYLLDLARAGLDDGSEVPEGYAVVAERQSEGRGRLKGGGKRRQVPPCCARSCSGPISSRGSSPRRLGRWLSQRSRPAGRWPASSWPRNGQMTSWPPPEGRCPSERPPWQEARGAKSPACCRRSFRREPRGSGWGSAKDPCRDGGGHWDQCELAPGTGPRPSQRTPIWSPSPRRRPPSTRSRDARSTATSSWRGCFRSPGSRHAMLGEEKGQRIIASQYRQRLLDDRTQCPGRAARRDHRRPGARHRRFRESARGNRRLHPDDRGR